MCIRPATKHSTMYVLVRAAQDQKDITLSVLHKVLGVHKLPNSQLLIEACVMCCYNSTNLVVKASCTHQDLGPWPWIVV